MSRKVKITIIVIIVLSAIGCIGIWRWLLKGNHDSVFRTAQVKRGELLASISATGTIEPTVVVDVGAQVNGIIKSFGKDENGKAIDYSSVVDAGMVLARIDDSLYVAAVDAAKAQLKQALANKISAEASVLQMKATLHKAQLDWDRAQKLGPSDALSKSDYDQYQATYEVSKANLAAAQAAVEQTNAAVALSKANLHTAQINLGYCTITAPVKGVIVDRQVNIGQTVVSSLSATSLFLLAKDLKKITAWVSVNEADIGSIYAGQPVTFTIDAFPSREFKGVVGKIRLNATMTQNVVTYTVEVDTDNDDGKLLPYLTTNAKFITGRRKNVLLVPNAALRWTPRPGQIEPDFREKHHSDKDVIRDKGGSNHVEAMQTRGTLWIEQGKFVRPIHVKTGLTDGAFTEIDGKDAAEGMLVVTGESPREATAGEGTERSPLMPQPMGRGQRPEQPANPQNPGAVRDR